MFFCLNSVVLACQSIILRTRRVPSNYPQGTLRFLLRDWALRVFTFNFMLLRDYQQFGGNLRGNLLYYATASRMHPSAISHHVRMIRTSVRAIRYLTASSFTYRVRRIITRSRRVITIPAGQATRIRRSLQYGGGRNQGLINSAFH